MQAGMSRAGMSRAGKIAVLKRLHPLPFAGSRMRRLHGLFLKYGLHVMLDATVQSSIVIDGKHNGQSLVAQLEIGQ